MSSFLTRLTIIFITLLEFGNGNQFDEGVQKELKAIRAYELTHFDVKSIPFGKMIEFDAFNNHYKVELVEDHHRIPSNIHHTNGNLAEKYNLKQFYTHLTRSCHYTGEVLNTNESSIASISICPTSGITGRIYAFGDWLMIKPSKYYFDREYDRSAVHDAHDEHIVYRLSDYDHSHINLDGDVVRDLHHLHGEFKQPQTKNPKRRRLSSDDVYIQVYILAEQSFVDKFKSGYSGMWYGKMVQYLNDVLAGVSAIYNNGDWGTDFGAFSFILAELNVVEENTDIYRPLGEGRTKNSDGEWKLHPIYDAFGTLIDDGTLNIDWSGSDASSGRIDQATIFVDLVSSPTGIASMSGIDEGEPNGDQDSGAFCEHSRWTKPYVIMSDEGGLATSQTVYSHEFGHNFGMQHDGEDELYYANDCAAGPGVMSPSAGWSQWSSCSISYLRHHFEANDGLQCLRNMGDGQLISNENGDLLTERTIDASKQCVRMSQLNLLFDGEWKPSGTYNGKTVYIKSGLSLFWTKYTSNSYYWVIFNELRDADPDDNYDKIWWQGDCDKEDITLCGSEWDTEDAPNAQFTKVGCSDENSTGFSSTTTSTSSTTTTTPAPTTTTTTTTTQVTEPQCVTVSNFDDASFNGVWKEESSFNNKPAYKKDEYWLFYSDDDGFYWGIYTALEQGTSNSDVWILGWCDRSSIDDCDGEWEKYSQYGPKDDDVQFVVSTCSDDATTTSSTSTTSTTTSTTSSTTTTTSTTSTSNSDTEQEFWFDEMDNFADNWVVTVTDDDPTSYITHNSRVCNTKCVRIRGGNNWIVRETELTTSCTSYTLLFDVFLNSMETGDQCKVSYSFDGSDYELLASFDGDGNDRNELNQEVSFDGASSSVLHIRLETDASSSSGGDKCCYDNVGLKGACDDQITYDYGHNIDNTQATDCISLQIVNLGAEFDGEWIKTGDTLYEKDGKYLTPIDEDGTDYWTITASQNSADWSGGWCSRTNIDDCDGDWWFDNGRNDICEFHEQPCGAYTAKDLDCIEDTEYQSNICVHHNGSVVEYELYDECANDQPMYQYVDEDITYFIWYDMINDHGQWVLSKGMISSKSIAYCREENIFDCDDGDWITKKKGDDVQRWVKVENLVVFNGVCGTSSDKKGYNPVVFGIFIGFAVVIVISATFMIVCFLQRRKVMRKFTKREEVLDEEPIELETSIEFGDTQHSPIVD